ncbi:hypothetical protein [Rhizobacter sp. Root1221]|uniref:hypothetical protein n=1 Tax=Rhizobacter sp. Root1221 TaxID=1736433 RepID=UPI000ACF6606|nr:hypothetical protein [Rhizobacter sp. Root1221]
MLKMKSVGLVLVCGSLLGTAIDATAGKVSTVSLNGVGTFECGRYLAYRKSDPETMTPMFQQWAAGYFAGYSAAYTKPGRETNLAVDLETYTAWLDKWCADDPSSSITSGLNALIQRRLKAGSTR